MLQDLKNRSFIWNNQLSQSKSGPEKARLGYKLFEEEIQKHDLSNVSCSKGCSFCCRWKVEITDEEAELLAGLIATGQAKVNLQKLEKQAEVDPEGSTWKLPSEATQCVFQDKSGSCSVYENRPITCRKAFVVSAPKLCGDPGQSGVEPLLIPEIELLTSLVWSQTDDDVAPLPHSVWRNLNERS